MQLIGPSAQEISNLFLFFLFKETRRPSIIVSSADRRSNEHGRQSIIRVRHIFLFYLVYLLLFFFDNVTRAGRVNRKKKNEIERCTNPSSPSSSSSSARSFRWKTKQNTIAIGARRNGTPRTERPHKEKTKKKERKRETRNNNERLEQIFQPDDI